MGGRADRLVGRENALAVGRSALDRAMSGDGQFVLISGEPGIGKTTVVNALAAAAAPDVLVLRGFCWDGLGVPPYWPWSQVLSQAQATGVLPDVALGEAARLVRRIPGGGTGDVAEAADAQFRLFDATGRYLARLAADRPTLIAVDDLHWADDGTLSLLSFLSRALTAAPVLLLGAYRDTEAPAGLAALAERGQHVPLAGLTAAEVDQLVRTLPGDPLPDDAVRQLWLRSGGNPFFVQELATLARSQGAALSSHLPESVIETVRRRLARLPTDCVRLLEYAAVAGSHIDLSLLVATGAADSEESAADLLDDAVRARIATGADQLRFRHDLYRDAILAGTGAARRSAINLAVATALQAGPRRGDAARIAGHLRAAGPAGRTRALEYTVRAAREATARLGHTDAARSYQQAVDLLGDDDVDRPGLVLELAGACARAGMTKASADRYREAADLARSADDPVMFAESALGLHGLGQRSGAQAAEVLSILDEAARRLQECAGPLALRSQVVAALARVGRHSAGAGDAGLVRSAQRAVELAEAAHDDRAVANAYLALHDARWSPGSAVDRLPAITAMLAAAHRAADADLLAQAELLHATALIELGDPAGREVLFRYIDLAERLGHARGRWGALTRQATFAQIAGQVQQAARLGEEALILGRAIGEPDADGCFGTHRWSLVALGVREPEIQMDAVDPLWSLAPLIAAWPPAARGENDLARELLGDFSVVGIAPNTDLEQLAVAAVVFAAVGSADQRHWAYEALLPYAGTHVVIGGCAAYHAAVDHHLGALAVALGDLDAAENHYAAALSMHRRLGAAGWERVTEQALEQLRAARRTPHRFRQTDGGWAVTYAGQDIRLPAAKGLHDIWVILGAGGAAVHVRTLLGDDTASASVGNGADPVLDERARREYRDRIRVMDEGIEDADRRGDAVRSGRLHTERDVLVRELSTAAGLGGRARRLGDDAERARKTVGARIRDALGRLDMVHPALAHHLRDGLQLGTTCCYRPTEPTQWTLR